MQIYNITTPDDIKEVAKLAERIWREHYTPIIGAAQVAYMIKTFQSEDAIQEQLVDGYQYCMAVRDGLPAGYSAMRHDQEKSALFLSKLYVDKNYRDQGIGKAMLWFNREALAGQPADYIWLTVNKQNIDSIKAYQRLGFIITDSIVTDIGQGYVMDDYVMKKVFE